MYLTTRSLHEGKNTRAMRCSCNIIIRNDAKRKDGTCLICLQAFIESKRVVINLGIYCLESEFDKKSGKIRQGKKNANDYNLLIGQAEARANKIFIDYRLESRILNTDIFKREFENPDDRSNFLTFFERELQGRKDKIEPGTWAQNKFVLDKLKKFSPAVTFSDLTPAFLEKFDTWMKKKLGNCENTRMKSLTTVRIYSTLAIKRGIKFENPFLNFQIKRIQTNVEALTETELKQLYTYYNSKDCKAQHRKVLTHFLFSCFTSLRISDLRQINSENIVENTLVLIPQKTKRVNKMVRIPLTETAKRFINENVLGQLFEMFSDQYSNRILKDIEKLLELSTDLHNHTGRHTFATLFLEKGGRVEVLKDLMGHSDIKTTMIYIHVTDKRKQEQMKGMDLIL